MNELPVSINPCPIIEAIFEIRFESFLPDDAIFGIVYNQFKDEFQQVEQLPVLQLPAAIRNQDTNLKFTPHYKIKKENFIIQIGPKVFSLANLNDYCGWDKFSKKIHDTYHKLSKLKLINKHYRTALRYINVFPGINIFNKSNFKILLNDEMINDNKINFSSEFPYEHGASNLKLINHAEAAIENQVVKGSIIDIDTNVEINKFDSFQDAIECAHHAEKTLFFDLLGNEFLLSLNPDYEEK